MSRVLLTGAAGFIGQPVLERLQAAGHEVHAVGRSDGPTGLAGLTWHRVDLLDGAASEELIAELAPEGLVHLAWYVVHGRFWRARENLAWSEATLRLLRAFAAAGGTRAVITGTCAEYDWTTDGPYTEDSPLAPVSLYGWAKHSTQQLTRAFADEVGISLAWARLFIPYGPGEPAGRLIPSIANGVLAGSRVPVTDGSQVRDFMFVEDVADALVEIFESPSEGAINLATGTAVSVRELIEAVAAEAGRPELIEWGALPQRSDEPARLLADVHRLRDEIGYSSSVPLPEGIARTVESLRANRR